MPMEHRGNESFLRGSAGAVAWSGIERRKRVRVGVQWELRFCLGPENLIFTSTQNVSSEGFYCVADEPVPGGDHECVILVPANAPNARKFLYLRCQVQILRIDPLDQKRFGIAARIQNYHASKGSSQNG